jgi:ribosomal 50S subunit-recycling heat shock protein
MRLDKYLKVSRLIKRRTVANEACDNGRISVNGRVVKASYEVKVGDKIEIAMGARTIAVEVLQVADNVRKDDAGAMYKEVL